MDCSRPGSSVHGDSPSKSTAVGCHALLQGIFSIQASNPCLLHWQVGSLSLVQPGKPIIYPLLCCAVLCCCLVVQSCPTLCPMDCSLPGSSVHGDSPSKNTRVGCHTLLQGIFSTQGLNPDLLHYRQILYHLSHQGSPRILKWVAYSFSRGFSQTRSPALQADSSPSEPPRKPKNTGVGSLSLLQGIFPTQESSQGLLHCRWIFSNGATREALRPSAS